MEPETEPPPDEGAFADEAKGAAQPEAEKPETPEKPDEAEKPETPVEPEAKKAESAPAPIDETAPDEAPVALRPRRAAEDAAKPADTEEPPPVEETVPELPEVEQAPKEPEKPRRRTWLRVLVAFVGVLLGAGIALAVIAPRYVRDRVVEEARALGLVITFKDVDVGFERVSLDKVTLSLVGVPDMEAQADRIEVDLLDWQPRAVRAKGLSMALVGTSVLEQLSAWKNAHPKALAAPFDAEAATIDWHPSKGVDKALSFADARVTVDPKKGLIESKQTVFLGRDAGPVKTNWESDDIGFSVEMQPRAAPLSAIHIDITAAKDASPRERPNVTVTLARTKLAELQTALGLPKGSDALEAEGEVKMPLPSLDKPAPIEGSIRLSVKGYVPPHPRELDGILFGNVTKVRSDFTVEPDFSRAKLSQVQVEAGALALRGLGDVDRDGFDATVALTLKGTIPCTALATSAAVAHLGAEWGKLAGGLASGALRGNVLVVLTVETKASDIASAKIEKSARLGCKISVPGLPVIVIK